MAFRSTEFNKEDQIRQYEGEFRSNTSALEGSEPEVPKVKFLEVAHIGGVEKFDPKKEGAKSDRASNRRKKKRENKIRKYFRSVDLTEEQEKAVKTDIKRCIQDWRKNRGDMETRLARWNDLVEGIREESDFPWEGAANLHIPLIEIQMNIIHSAIRQTMLKNDNLWVGEYFGVDNDMLTQMLIIENFLNFKSRTDLSLSSVLSDFAWSTLRDGTSIGQVTWADEREMVVRFVEYKTIEEFQEAFPGASESGIPDKEYIRILEALNKGEPVELEEEHERIVYRGPLVDLVDLNDFVMSPITAKETRFASLVGKRFRVPLSNVYSSELDGWYKDGSGDAIKKHLNSQEQADFYTSQRDSIEGINRSIEDKDAILVDGIHRFDLDKDNVNEKYAFCYDEGSDTLLAYWHYPYEHGRDCFVPVRFKKRPNRFFGRSLPEQLEDINEEIDTQHNQRTNSRTITTVPTFKARNSIKGDFDPTRRDQIFKPGRTYWLSRPEDLTQFDIRETDFSQSEREEQTLFQIADTLTGATQLRSGGETRLDPRAPALKVQTLLQRSDVRLDDAMEEMAGDSGRNEGFNAIGFQALELYRQFGDEEDLKFLDTVEPREIDMATGRLSAGQAKIAELDAKSIDSEKMKIMMSKTSVSQNPEVQFQKEYLIYQILVQEPLVGGQEQMRMQMVSDLLASARKEKMRRLLVQRMNSRPPEAAQAEQNMLLQNVLGFGGQNGSSRTGQAGIPTQPA